MSVIKKLSFPDNKFDLYFLAYDSPGAVSHGAGTFDREGVIELTHNYGTESDDSYAANTGNKEPHRGFGHVCVSVDHIEAACDRIEKAGYRFQKKLTDGRMRNIAFALDPDGYWVEIVSQDRASEGAGDPAEKGVETDVGTYRMVSSKCCPYPISKSDGHRRGAELFTVCHPLNCTNIGVLLPPSTTP